MSRKKAPVKVEVQMHPMLWKTITQEDLTKLDQLSPEEAEKYVADMMGLENYKNDLKDGSLVDYYLSHYWWASKLKSLTHEQTSIYFGIIHVLLDNLKEKHFARTDNFNEFKNYISQINQNVKLFSNDNIIEISDSINLDLFQHYKLYEFLFNDSPEDYVVSKLIPVEAPVPPELQYPPPLDEALPETIYNKYILKINDEVVESEVKQEEIDAQQIAQIEIPNGIESEIQSKFEGLSIDEAKRIIYEVTQEIVSDLKIDMRKTMKEREANLINELNKVSAKPDKKAK